MEVLVLARISVLLVLLPLNVLVMYLQVARNVLMIRIVSGVEMEIIAKIYPLLVRGLSLLIILLPLVLVTQTEIAPIVFKQMVVNGV